MLLAALLGGTFAARCLADEVLLSENFESGTLDQRISVSTVGSLNPGPRIVDSTVFGSQRAFDFGNSSCSNDCHERFVGSLLVTLPVPIFVTSVSFLWAELGGNTGAYGQVYVDGEPVAAFDGSGVVQSLEIPVGKTARRIQLRVSDIASGSRIQIDDLEIRGGSEPPAGCQGDIDGNNEVTIDELLAIVNNALDGCQAPASITGEYEGRAYESLSGQCSGQTGVLQILPDVTLEVSSQSGSGFVGSYTGHTSDGAAFTIEARGTVDATGKLTTGILTAGATAGRPFSGSFAGRVEGDTLALNYVGQSGACNVTGSVLGIKAAR